MTDKHHSYLAGSLAHSYRSGYGHGYGGYGYGSHYGGYGGYGGYGHPGYGGYGMRRCKDPETMLDAAADWLVPFNPERPLTSS